jgi:hypothetical protein
VAALKDVKKICIIGLSVEIGPRPDLTQVHTTARVCVHSVPLRSQSMLGQRTSTETNKESEAMRPKRASLMLASNLTASTSIRGTSLRQVSNTQANNGVACKHRGGCISESHIAAVRGLALHAGRCEAEFSSSSQSFMVIGKHIAGVWTLRYAIASKIDVVLHASECDHIHSLADAGLVSIKPVVPINSKWSRR